MRGVACSLKAQKRALAGVCVYLCARTYHTCSRALWQQHTLYKLSLVLWLSGARAHSPGCRASGLT